MYEKKDIIGNHGGVGLGFGFVRLFQNETEFVVRKQRLSSRL